MRSHDGAMQLLRCGLGLVPFILGCGSSQHAVVPPPAPDVAGHWVTDCAPSPDGKGNFKMDFHNTTAHWQVAYTVFGDPACTAALVEVDIEGAYGIGAPSPTVAGARDAVFHFASKTVTPKIQGLADAINAMPGCGGGFALGVAKDVYAHGCPRARPVSRCELRRGLRPRRARGQSVAVRPAPRRQQPVHARPSAARARAVRGSSRRLAPRISMLGVK